MKWFFRWAFRLLILLIVLAVAGILLMDTLLREWAEYQIKNQTGLEARIGKLNVGLFQPVVTAENIIIYNNARFGGSPFIEMPELHFEYDAAALWSGKLRCKLVRINLARINLVEDAKGVRNYELLQKKIGPLVVLDAKPAKGTPAAKNSRQVVFAGIDTLNMTLGKATYLRMQQPGKMEEFPMNVNHQVFTGIKTDADFSSILLIALIKSGANVMQMGNTQNWLQLVAPRK
jgi:uncharacterized protein involved in outer membrane biogenesis